PRAWPPAWSTARLRPCTRRRAARAQLPVREAPCCGSCQVLATTATRDRADRSADAQHDEAEQDPSGDRDPRQVESGAGARGEHEQWVSARGDQDVVLDEPLDALEPQEAGGAEDGGEGGERGVDDDELFFWGVGDAVAVGVAHEASSGRRTEM